MIRSFFAAALLLATATASEAAEFYVSPSGSDTGSGAITQPWRTVTRGLKSVYAGDTLYLRGGVYQERVTQATLRRGTPTAPITVRAFPGERPVIQGLLWLSRPYYWNFSGINVTWDSATGLRTEHMVKVTNGIGWSFEHAEIWGARSYAGVLVASTTAGEPANWRIADCAIHDTYKSNSTNQDHLIYCNAGLYGSGGVIERNLLYNATNGEGVKLGGPSATSGGTAGVTVRHNTVYNTSQSILIAGLSHSNRIYGNILDRVGSYSHAIRGYKLAGQDNVAYGNLVYRARGVIYNDPGYVGVRDLGGNVFPIDPMWDAVDLNGFHPNNAVAWDYGRYAP